MPTMLHSHHTRATLIAPGVAELTICNAKSMNILGTPVIEELTKAVTALATHSGLRVLVLRGSGDKAFIGGADIHEMAALQPASARAFITRLKDLCDAVHRFPAPTIARLSGYCLGGGLEVALACDLRLASHDGQFGMPEVKVGIPSVIHAALLPRLIGGSRAAWMLLTGENVGAAQALDWGLVHQVCEDGALDSEVLRLANQLAAMGSAALHQQKALLRAWETQSLPEAVEASVAVFGEAFAAGEPQHFMQAFAQRPRGT